MTFTRLKHNSLELPARLTFWGGMSGGRFRGLRFCGGGLGSAPVIAGFVVYDSFVFTVRRLIRDRFWFCHLFSVGGGAKLKDV